MIVTVHQLLEAAAAVQGQPTEARVELSLANKFLVGHVIPPRACGFSSRPLTVQTHVGFSLPPAPGPAED